MDCFSRLPKECDEGEIRDVSFFYHVALVAVDKRIKNEMMVAAQGGVMGVMRCPRLWASNMAYAMVLVANFSDLDNIIHNATLKRKSGSEIFKDCTNKDLDSSDDIDENEDDSYNTRKRRNRAGGIDSEAKKKKKKMNTKSTQEHTANLYSSAYNFFYEKRTTGGGTRRAGEILQADCPGQEEQIDPAQAQKTMIQETSKIFIAWEKQVKILVPKESAAKRRKSVAPPMPELGKVAGNNESLQMETWKQFLEEKTNQEEEASFVAGNGSFLPGCLAGRYCA